MEHPDITTQHVPRETFSDVDQLLKKYHDSLEIYLDQLLWWNKRINLVSRNVSRETIRQHIRHSLLVSSFDDFKSSTLFVDAGTGGGLPGIPLAITHPQKHLVLNDLVTKKCLAVKQIAQKLALDNIGIVDGSIEQLQQEHSFVLISKHAFKINELFDLAGHLPWQKMILYKGQNFKKELEGITDTISIKQFNLPDDLPFYKGKAIVVISR